MTSSELPIISRWVFIFSSPPSPPLPTPILRLACATPIFVIPLHRLVVVIPPRRIPQPHPLVVIIPLSLLLLPTLPLICLPLPSSSSPHLLQHLSSPPHSQAGLHYPYVICLFAFVYCIACTCIMSCCCLCHRPPSARRRCHAHTSAHLLAAAVIVITLRGLPILGSALHAHSQAGLHYPYVICFCTFVLYIVLLAHVLCYAVVIPPHPLVIIVILPTLHPPAPGFAFLLMLVYCIVCTCTCIMLCINFPFSFFQLVSM